MLELVMSITINGPADMVRLEEKIVSILGGEHHKCSFIRSNGFVSLRLNALYGKTWDKGMLVVGPGLELTLAPDKTIRLYLYQSSVDVDPVLGKRLAPEETDCVPVPVPMLRKRVCLDEDDD
jgi:hypothetical protein